MKKLRVAILGVGSIGEFHAREFKNAGCEVVAILTSSMQSAHEKSKKLKNSYDIAAKPYWDIEELLSKEKIDAVSICTPPQFHSEQVRKCLEYNLNVLCEKPFIQDSDCDNYQIARKIFDLAKEKWKVLSVNTQLVSILDYVPKKYLSGNLNEFSMYMEPNKEGVINLITEVVPHMNSLLMHLAGDKIIKNIKFPVAEKNSVKIQFNYGDCKVEYNIGVKKERPRKLKFSINEKEFEREIGDNYKQKLVYDKYSIDIEDPLSISIRKFAKHIKSNNKLPVNNLEILNNVKLQDLIIKRYLLTI
jgi:hypothetical protein